MPRQWSIEEDTVLLNMKRRHKAEDIARALARPVSAIIARLEYFSDKRLTTGQDGEVVIYTGIISSIGIGDPELSRSASAQKRMEETTFDIKL